MTLGKGKSVVDLFDDKGGSTEAILLPWRSRLCKFPLISWGTYNSLDTVGISLLAVLSSHKQTFGQKPLELAIIKNVYEF